MERPQNQPPPSPQEDPSPAKAENLPAHVTTQIAPPPPSDKENPSTAQAKNSKCVKYGPGSRKGGNHAHRRYECTTPAKAPKCVLEKKRRRDSLLKTLRPGTMIVHNSGDRLKLMWFCSRTENDSFVNAKCSVFAEPFKVQIDDICEAYNIDLDKITAGTPVCVLGDYNSMQLRFAIFSRHDGNQIYFTVDDSGVEYCCPHFECLELPNFQVALGQDFVNIAEPREANMQSAIKLFSAMVKRLKDENSLMAKEYLDKCQEIHRYYQNDILSRDMAIVALKEQFLSDLETYRNIDSLWRQRWAKNHENTLGLHKYVEGLEKEIQGKDSELEKCKTEIANLKESINFQRKYALDTERRLRHQIDAMKAKINLLTKQTESKDQELAEQSVEIIKLKDSILERDCEIRNLKSKLSAFENNSYLEVNNNQANLDNGHAVFSARKAGCTKRSSQFLKVPKVAITSSEANFRTMSQRSLILKNILHLLSAPTQPSEDDLIATLTHFARNNPEITLEACRQAKLVDVQKLSPGDCVELKVMLKLPMNRFRDLRRFLTNNGIYILASEQLMREEMKSRVPSDTLIEVGVAQLEKVSGGPPVPTAFCRVQNVQGVIEHVVQKNKGVPELGLTFRDELWLKLGGDKGSSTTKFVLQVANYKNPNAPEKTELLGLFESQDTNKNLWEMFSPLRDEVCDLHKKVVHFAEADKEFMLRVFLFGDYMFLSNILGHQGPSSSFPCIFCHVPLAHLRNGKGKPHTPMIFDQEAGKFVKHTPCTYTKRSKESYQEDLAGFLSDPRNPRDPGQNGKYHNSVTHDSLFPIDIDHVVPPPLHIFLGLVKSCYEMLETDCIALDRVEMKESEKKDVSELYDQWQTLSHRANDADEELKVVNDLRREVEGVLEMVQRNRGKPKPRVHQECSSPVCIEPLHSQNTKWVGCDQCEAWVHFRCSDLPKADEALVDDESYQYLCFECRDIDSPAKLVSHISEKLDNAVKEQEHVKKKHSEIHKELDSVFADVKKYQGPRECMLTKILEKDLLVIKQAYHSNSFIGNHCKKIISHADKLLRVISDQESFQNYSKLFKSLNTIHSLVSVARFLSEEEIIMVSEECWRFGEWFPTTFTDASVTIKLHMLVFHVPEFIAQWKTLGLMSEHGAESIHRLINSDQRVYSSVRDHSEQFRLVYANHALRSSTNPENLTVQARVCKFERDGKPCGGRFKKSPKTKERECPKCNPELF